jgi:hypothetical protein
MRTSASCGIDANSTRGGADFMDVCGHALVMTLADFVADYDGDDETDDEWCECCADWLSEGDAACSQSPETSALSADVGLGPMAFGQCHYECKATTNRVPSLVPL